MARNLAPHPRRENIVNWQVSIRPDADLDLREDYEWYEAHREGMGDEFLTAAAESFSRLEEAPLQFPLYFAQYRRVLMRRFPYKVFFRIEGDAVIVLRVLHAAREHEWRLR
jgi:toxin ParE1/3/4